MLFLLGYWVDWLLVGREEKFGGTGNFSRRRDEQIFRWWGGIPSYPPMSPSRENPVVGHSKKLEQYNNLKARSCVFSIFLWQGSRAEMPHKVTVVKIWEQSRNIYISWNPVYLHMCDRSFNMWSAFWHCNVICFSKYSLLSISMPNSVMEWSSDVQHTQPLNQWPVDDHWLDHNRVCDCRKAFLNGHHDCQYLDVTTYFCTFTAFYKTIFVIFWNRKPNLQRKRYIGNWECGDCQ